MTDTLDLEAVKKVAEAFDAILREGEARYDRGECTTPAEAARYTDAMLAFNAAVTPPTVLSLLAELEACRTALKPFAEQAEAYPDSDRDHVADWPTFTVGDFRAARSALTQENGPVPMKNWQDTGHRYE